MRNRKSILITGGSGFIGRNLKEYLSERYEVIAPSHKELDLLDTESVRLFFRKNKVDVIIHAANRGGKRNDKGQTDIVKTNMRMFFNIVECEKYFGKMIFLGSGAEYDRTKDVKDVKESYFGKNIPSDDYGFYKYVCSEYIEKSDRIVNLRLFGVFGRHEDYNVRFISNIICRDIFDLPVEMNQDRVMDYVYIDDLCRIVEYFIKNKPNKKFYNIGGERHMQLTELAGKVRKITGRKREIKIKKKGFDKEYTCDNSQLLKEIKGFKFTNMDESIKSVYDWYIQNKSKINKEELLRY